MANEVLKKFSAHLRQTLHTAMHHAETLGAAEVQPEHLFLGILQEHGSLANELLKRFNITEKSFFQKQLLKKESRSSTFQEAYLPLGDQGKKMLERATTAAAQFKHRYIGTEHLLYALLHDASIIKILEKKNAPKKAIKDQIISALRSTSHFPDITAIFREVKRQAELMEQEDHGHSPKSKTPALDFFATELTTPTIQETIDPVVGREKEIDRIIHILCRRTKNNPLLIGEAGVGKTAIVEGLAKRILEQKVPQILLNKRIFRLDLGLVIAGTTYRGEFEARFKQIVEELEKNPHFILFIDEIHMLVGAGSGGGGSMDAANILKPALAKGKLHCIGATTLDEYKKYIESDSALERRFQPIFIEEPSPEESALILQGLKKYYEQFHGVGISENAIHQAIKLSERYVQEKNFPDKAIDLIDEAAARVKVHLPPDPLLTQIQNLEKEIEALQEEKIQLVQKEKYDKAMEIKQRENILRAQWAAVKQAKRQSKETSSAMVTERDVAEIIAQLTKIPLHDLLEEDKRKLLALEQVLNQYVIGQKEATKTAADFIRRSRAGLTSPKRPTASFLFLGSSGVGKTELAKVLARILFGDEKNLLKIDMSEFSQEFNISKLIGAPAGYVGYKEGALLSDFVKHHPYCVILLDEIEKAHPNVFNLLLQILDEGKLTDAMGKNINFKNTIIIMTSNVGIENFTHSASIGFEEGIKETSDFEKIKNEIQLALKETFRPEFLNRIDRTIMFQPLTPEDLAHIVGLQMKDLNHRLSEKNLAIEADLDVLRFIAEKSFSPEEGARAIQKTLQETVEEPLAEMIIQDDARPGDRIKAVLRNKNIVLEKSPLP